MLERKLKGKRAQYREVRRGLKRESIRESPKESPREGSRKRDLRFQEEELMRERSRVRDQE